jgi:protein-arginine kinase activator protein McsA
MICNSCDKSKANLKFVKSKLLPGIPLYMCDTCIRNGYEPRYVIVLAGRKFGPETVKTHILKNKYIGRPIEFSEIITPS